jgi:hypothetical protein
MNLSIFRSYFLLLGATLAFNTMLGKPAYAVQKDHETADGSPLHGSITQDMFFQIRSHLPRTDLDALHLVSAGMHKSCLKYEEDLRGILIRQLNTLNPPLSRHQTSHLLSLSVTNNKMRRDMFVQLLQKMGEKESFIFVTQGSPLAPILHKTFATLQTEDLLQGIDIAKEIYTGLFHSEFPKRDDDSTLLALRHMQAVWPMQGVYISSSLKTEGVEKFLDYYNRALRASPITEPYFSLNLPVDVTDVSKLKNDALKLKKTPHHIVITAGQLRDPIFKNMLNELLCRTSNHTVILNVGDSVNAGAGMLSLSTDDIAPAIQRLRLVDPEGKITAIGEYFLRFSHLSSLDLSGLSNVSSIEHGFLDQCVDLTSLELPGFNSLKEIGHGFLSRSFKLPSVDLSGFSNVTKIENGFLEHCMSLTDEEEKNKIALFLEAVRSRANLIDQSAHIYI